MLHINLTGKVALITGAAGGLGRQMALDLAGCGCDVCLSVCSSAEEARSIARRIESDFGRRSLVVQGDVRSSADARRMADEASQYFGKPAQILVNNAGYYREYGKISEVSDEIIDRTIDTNLKGSFYMTRAVSSALIAADLPGSIINISSGAGHSGRVHHAHYCASKGGILMLTKASALDLAAHRINVNSISVGFVDVGRFDQGELQAVKRDILPRILLRRAGKPRDISAMVCYLASEFADWITGSDIRIDGGESAGRVPPM